MIEEQMDSTLAAVAFSVFALSTLVLLYAVPRTFGLWKLFQRAKKPGVASVIPFYNTYIQGQIAKKPGLALLINVALAGLVALALTTGVASADVQPLMIISALLLLVFLFMTFEELDKHFLKHFGLSKNSLEGRGSSLLKAVNKKKK